MSKKAKRILAELEPIPESMPSLSVVVDFNQLHADHGTEAFELIGQLKNLLR